MSLTRSPIRAHNRQPLDLDLELSIDQDMTQPLQPLNHPIQPTPPQHEKCKLPVFYDKYPQQWFVLVESQFRIKNVNLENNKYECLLSTLPQDVATTVTDIIQNINDNWNEPNLTPYTMLKEALLDRNSLSESQRLETLLKDIDIGDRKPSEFYRALKQTAGQSDSITDKLITQLWIRKLPMQIQISLKTLPNPDSKTLVNMADSIYEIFSMNNRGHLQAISPQISIEDNNSNDRFNRLEEQIKSLTESIKQLTTNTYHRSRSRTRSNSRSKKNQSNSSELCWYHNKFGNLANKCIPPCNFSKN